MSSRSGDYIDLMTRKLLDVTKKLEVLKNLIL